MIIIRDLSTETIKTKLSCWYGPSRFHSTNLHYVRVQAIFKRTKALWSPTAEGIWKVNAFLNNSICHTNKKSSLSSKINRAIVVCMAVTERNGSGHKIFALNVVIIEMFRKTPYIVFNLECTKQENLVIKNTSDTSIRSAVTFLKHYWHADLKISISSNC